MEETVKSNNSKVLVDATEAGKCRTYGGLLLVEEVVRRLCTSESIVANVVQAYRAGSTCENIAQEHLASVVLGFDTHKLTRVVSGILREHMSAEELWMLGHNPNKRFTAEDLASGGRASAGHAPTRNFHVQLARGRKTQGFIEWTQEQEVLLMNLALEEDNHQRLPGSKKVRELGGIPTCDIEKLTQVFNKRLGLVNGSVFKPIQCQRKLANLRMHIRKNPEELPAHYPQAFIQQALWSRMSDTASALQAVLESYPQDDSWKKEVRSSRQALVHILAIAEGSDGYITHWNALFQRTKEALGEK